MRRSLEQAERHADPDKSAVALVRHRRCREPRLAASPSFAARPPRALSIKAPRRRPRVGCSDLKCEARDVLAAAALVLVALCAVGRDDPRARETSDLLFYVCAFAQAALAVLGARLAARAGASAFAVLVFGAALLRLAFVVQTPDAVGRRLSLHMGRPGDRRGLQPLPARSGRSCADRAARSRSICVDRQARLRGDDLSARRRGDLCAGDADLDPRLAMKLAMVLFEAAAVFAIARLLRRLGRAPAEADRLSPASRADLGDRRQRPRRRRDDGVPVRRLRDRRREPALRRGDPDDARGAGEADRSARASRALASRFRSACRFSCWRWRRFLYLPFAAPERRVIGFLPRYLEEQGLTNGKGVFWLVLLGKAGLLRPAMAAGLRGVSTGLALLALALWTRQRGAVDLASGLTGTALLLVAFLLAVTPTFPWYFLAPLPMTPLPRLWSPTPSQPAVFFSMVSRPTRRPFSGGGPFFMATRGRGCDPRPGTSGQGRRGMKLELGGRPLEAGPR